MGAAFLFQAIENLQQRHLESVAHAIRLHSLVTEMGRQRQLVEDFVKSYSAGQMRLLSIITAPTMPITPQRSSDMDGTADGAVGVSSSVKSDAIHGAVAACCSVATESVVGGVRGTHSASAAALQRAVLSGGGGTDMDVGGGDVADAYGQCVALLLVLRASKSLLENRLRKIQALKAELST